MKKFTKLALASSIAFSANAMAMQALDDATMSATTGQDGITIGIGISKITIDKLFIHDTDGLARDANNTLTPMNPTGVTVVPQPIAGGTGEAGAIVIQGTTDPTKVTDITLTNGTQIKSSDFGIYVGANYKDNGKYLLQTGNLADLKIDSDAGTGTNGAFINIAAQVSGLEVVINEIGVTGSNANDSAAADTIRRGGDTANYNPILSGLSLLTGPMTANIQLGAAPQGAMVKLDAVMIGGLEIKNLGILDNSTKSATRAAGEVFIKSIKLTDAEKTDLTLSQTISIFGESAANKGFLRIVSTSGAHDTYVHGVHLGNRDAASIGDIEVQGMQTYYSPAQGAYAPGAIITIKGH